MSNRAPEILEIYDYLRAPVLPADTVPAVVFGRNDTLVATAAGQLVSQKLASVLVISGGVGKDTDDLLDRGYKSEAHYLETRVGDILHHNVPPILRDDKAKHGHENARNSLRLLDRNNYPISATTAVAHATSLRRLAETLRFETVRRLTLEPRIYRQPTNQPFNPNDPRDKDEAIAEFQRLMDWPALGLLLRPGEELPSNLVDFVRDLNRPTPMPPSRLANFALGLLPPKKRVWVINRIAARQGIRSTSA